MTQDPWTERVSEYLDEELSRDERTAFEAHLRECAECGALVEELRAVRARARGLDDVRPPEDLWPGIEVAIAGRRIAALPSREARVDRGGRADRGWNRGRGRFSFSLPQLVAACLAVAIVSGGTVYAVLKQRAGVTPGTAGASRTAPGGGSAPGAGTELGADSGPGAVTEPSSGAGFGANSSQGSGVAAFPAPDTGTVMASTGPSAESPREEAVMEIRQALARGRGTLDPVTVRTLESNLAIIEIAIDQAKRALAADPANSYVREHLAATMKRKVELLQRATVLASASNAEESR